MDQLDAHGRARDVFDSAIVKVGLSDWDAPTPCTDWTVRDLVNHVVYEQLWVPDVLARRTIEEVGDKYEGDVLADDPLRAWQVASDAARSAVLTPGSTEGEVHLSFGDHPAEEYLRQLTLDLTVHGWDLATAIGADAGVPDELAERLLAYAEPNHEQWAATGLFDPAVPVPADADPTTRLVALLGRRP